MHSHSLYPPNCQFRPLELFLSLGSALAACTRRPISSSTSGHHASISLVHHAQQQTHKSPPRSFGIHRLSACALLDAPRGTRRRDMLDDDRAFCKRLGVHHADSRQPRRFIRSEACKSPRLLRLNSRGISALQKYWLAGLKLPILSGILLELGYQSCFLVGIGHGQAVGKS